MYVDDKGDMTQQPIVGKITKGLVLGQFLPSSLEVSKIICNRESQDPGLIAGMSIHLVQSSPQTMDGIMIHKHMIYSHPTLNDTIICIPLIKLGIGFSQLQCFPKNSAGLTLSTKVE